MDHMRWIVPLVLLVPLTVDAAPKLAVTGVMIVGRAEPTGAWTDGPTHARRSDDPELAVVLVARQGKKKVYVVDDDVTPLSIGGRKVPNGLRRGFDEIELDGSIAVRWSKVEPHAWREDGLEAPNGSTTPYYSNVVTGGEKHGNWLGYDRITYFETPLAEFETGAGARRRDADAVPTEKDADLFGGLGTMRYKVEVKLPDGRILSTPGAEATDTFGIERSVHRVSIRRDDSYNGWLSSYFLVPEVFGSAGPGRDHQTERYTGADCADVLVGALRASGSRVDYSHVAGLTSFADLVVDPIDLDDDGRPAQPIRGVKVGDVIRIDYGGQWAAHTPRSWDHVAILWEDRSDPAGPRKGKADGLLDGFDLVVHMGHPRLVIEELREQTPAKVDVLRWNDKKLRRRADRR